MRHDKQTALIALSFEFTNLTSVSGGYLTSRGSQEFKDMERKRILKFYAQQTEANRLELDMFMLEGIRTKEIIDRYLHKNELQILDIGGGTGYYSFWLQQKGNHVTLVDLSPEHIELARKHGESTGIHLSHLETGDAVQLRFPNDQFDLIVLLGPLYHLIDRKERITALSEAKRVLKPGAVVLSAVISRYASMFDGFERDLVTDNLFFKMMRDDLSTGLHRNDADNPEYFTTAYFHTPKEIISEIEESGLKFEKLIAVESFGWVINNFREKIKNADYMEKLLGTIKTVEENEDLVAMSPHIIAVARKE